MTWPVQHPSRSVRNRYDSAHACMADHQIRSHRSHVRVHYPFVLSYSVWCYVVMISIWHSKRPTCGDMIESGGCLMHGYGLRTAPARRRRNWELVAAWPVRCARRRGAAIMWAWPVRCAPLVLVARASDAIAATWMDKDRCSRARGTSRESQNLAALRRKSGGTWW